MFYRELQHMDTHIVGQPEKIGVHSVETLDASERTCQE